MDDEQLLSPLVPPPPRKKNGGPRCSFAAKIAVIFIAVFALGVVTTVVVVLCGQGKCQMRPPKSPKPSPPPAPPAPPGPPPQCGDLANSIFCSCDPQANTCSACNSTCPCSAAKPTPAQCDGCITCINNDTIPKSGRSEFLPQNWYRPLYSKRLSYMSARFSLCAIA